MNKLILVRHGQTAWNVLGKKQGQSDIELNAVGEEQAKELGIKLQNAKFDLVYTSPLKRTKRTAEIILQYNGFGGCVTEDVRIIERDFGEFEGLTDGEFDFGAFYDINALQKFERAESAFEVEDRVFEFLDELKLNQHNKIILIVGHGAANCAVCAYFWGRPKSGKYIDYMQDNAGILEFEL
ncbi:MAG: histidine phosphatase family protein [Christensenellaceae bacterium]|nr:histidine phosphatase family protein [Christensenellaceae bacterium]